MAESKTLTAEHGRSINSTPLKFKPASGKVSEVAPVSPSSVKGQSIGFENSDGKSKGHSSELESKLMNAYRVRMQERIKMLGWYKDLSTIDTSKLIDDLSAAYEKGIKSVCDPNRDPNGALRNVEADAAAVDFFTWVSKIKPLGITPGIALRIAEKGYWNSSVHKALQKEPFLQGHVNDRVLNAALTECATKPEDFINVFLELAAKKSQK
jgi:hypothetical protein